MAKVGRRKRKSRKGKKAWRKNVDATNELDELVLSNAPNQALFTFDSGSAILGEDGQEVKHRKRLENRRKLLHEDKLLIASKVNNKKTYNAYNKQVKGRIERLKEKEAAKKDLPPPPPPAPLVTDLWSTANEPVPRRIRRKAAQVKKSQMKAVAGQSYNPREEDHQEVLTLALAQVNKKLAPEDKLNAKILASKKRMKGVPSAMEVKLGDEEEVEEETEEMSKERKKLERELRENKKMLSSYSTKLTTAQRNKMKRVKLLRMKQQKQHAKAHRRKLLEKLPELVNEVEDREAELAIRQEFQKDADKLKAETGVLRLGKVKYEEKPVDFMYSEELPGNLRKLKPTGNLFDDLYDNLKKRNMVEPRNKIRYRPKYQIKTMEKRSAKNWREVI